MSTPNARLKLTEIWIYPVKSLAGVRVNTSRVFRKGLQYDRRFMLIDEAGKALTQRTHHRMALFRTSFNDHNVDVTFDGESIQIPLIPDVLATEVRAMVWNDAVVTGELHPDISKWFSERLDTTCRLVYFPETNARPVENRFRLNDDHVSLADAFPILIIGEASLDDLNHRLTTPVSMNRFRPNLVFTGGEPFAEDAWDIFRIGDQTFRAVKPCSRCVLTTIDQDTGTAGAEPLRTLSTYRKNNNKVHFGQNVLVADAEEIRTGIDIFVETYR